MFYLIVFLMNGCSAHFCIIKSHSLCRGQFFLFSQNESKLVVNKSFSLNGLIYEILFLQNASINEKRINTQQDFQ